MYSPALYECIFSLCATVCEEAPDSSSAFTAQRSQMTRVIPLSIISGFSFLSRSSERIESALPAFQSRIAFAKSNAAISRDSDETRSTSASVSFSLPTDFR